MNDDEKRGKYLANLRKEHNLKQSDLAKMINYSDKTISKWERGISFPKDTKVLIKLSEIFNVSIDDLLQGECSDIEGKNIFKTNNKILDFFIFNRTKIIVIILIIIVLIYILFIFLFDFRNVNDRTYLFRENTSKIDCIISKLVYFKKKNKSNKNDEDKTIYFDKNESIKNNKYSILLEHDFIYKDNYYYKKLNDNVDVYFYEVNNQIKIIYYLEKYTHYFIIFSNLNTENIIIEENYNLNVNNKFIKNDEKLNCDKEFCESPEDYAMYINYIKSLIKNS